MAHNHESAGARHRSRLLIVLALTSSYMIVEAVVGILADSLVLLADAGHMLTDVAGLSLALLAIWFAQRPATSTKTYGYYRAEILGALANAMLLFGISGYIFYEAIRRFQDPPEVSSVPLVIVASIGLCVNIIGAIVLLGGSKESLNIRGAFLEVASDMLGSAGAIAAGVILITTGWQYADPLFAAGVGLFILPRTWNLLKGALDILFEGTPSHIKMGAVEEEFLAVPGVQAIHDLHVWTVTSGFIALSGHVIASEGANTDEVLVALRKALAEKFDIDHITIQIESPSLEERLDQACLPESCYAPVAMAVPAAEPGTDGSAGMKVKPL